MKKFLILTTGAILLILLVYLGYDDSRIKKIKGNISINKVDSNLYYNYNNENDIKTIILAINNAKKVKASYKEVEKAYIKQYEIYLQHDNGNKSIYSLWADGDKSVMTEQWNGTLILSNEENLKLKELLKKLEKN